MRPTLFAVVAGLLLSGFGGDRTSPRETPGVAQVAGVWTVTETLNSVSGGDCLGEMVQTTLGRQDTGTLTITQSGSSLSAIFRDAKSGSSCSYAGTAGSGVIELRWTRCDAAILTNIRCANGALRDTRLAAKSISAFVSGGSASGSDAETWDVFVAGTRTEGQGVLVSDSSFAARRQ